MKPLFLVYLLLIAFSCSKKPQNPPVIMPPNDPPDSTVIPDPPVVKDTAVEYFVAPLQTDAAINEALDSHFVSVKEKSTLKNILFIFLPGSYAKPVQYKAIVRKAADLGYHAIGLMYPDDKPVNNFCANTNDTTCHRRARLEIVDGVDRSPNVTISPANCIVNRVHKLLVYLNTHHPAQHWGQFLTGDSVNWNMVIMGGHSQGGGNAAVMGRYYPLKKVIMFSMMDWMNNGKVPDWIKYDSQ
jgi:hypothetical protein